MTLSPPQSLIEQPRTSWEWQLDAHCRFFGSTLFFAPDEETYGDRMQRERKARQICQLCPVQTHCRNHALEVGEMHGVWGAMSEAELRGSIRRR